jgi:hypothetical protein
VRQVLDALLGAVGFLDIDARIGVCNRLAFYR